MLSVSVGGVAQVNVRVDRCLKESAEEMLRLSGRSLPELIKSVISKTAQSAEQCEEILAAVDSKPPIDCTSSSPFAASWASVDRLYRDLGISHFDESDDETCARDADTIYNEAMEEHYREKGLIS